MPRTVSDEEYSFLQQKRLTADFVESVYNDPQLNKDAKRLLKRKYPSLQIPDLDIEDKIDARFKAEADAKTKAAQDAALKRDQDAWNLSRAKVKKDYGFTDDGLKELEGWMQDHAVADHEVAASYRASKNPKMADPADYDRQFWRHDSADNFKEISSDPEAWARREILGAINRDEQRIRGR